MKQISTIFSWGLIISFLGSLLLGMINVTVTNIVLTTGVKAGLWFSAGAILIEIIYISIALLAMELLLKLQGFFRVFESLTILLLVVLSLASFDAVINMKGYSVPVPVYHTAPFITGMLISLINPLHIPFWFGWSTVLQDKKILIAGKASYTLYVTGIATGSLAGFAVFIFGSHVAAAYLRANEVVINYIIAIVLLIIAALQLYKIVLRAAAKRCVLVFDPQKR